MTITQLRYFCEVAKTRHFTAAANNLFVAQSSLSYAIQELESEMGVPLFVRRPNRRIELTSYGEKLLPYAEGGLKMLEDGKNEVKSMQSPLYGNVKIGFFFSVASTVVPTLIQKFQSDYPESRIRFDTEVYHNWMDLKEVLLTRRCDMIISAGNLAGNCKSVQIAKHRIVLLVPKKHVLSMCEKVTLQQMEQEPLIVIDPNSNMDTAIKNMFRNEGMTPRFTYVSNWGAQQLAVATGAGLGLSMDVPVNEKLLTKVEIDNPMSVLPVYLTWEKNQKLSQSVTFVRDYFLRLSESFEEDIIF